MSSHMISGQFSQHMREAKVFRRIMILAALILLGLQVYSWVGDEKDDAERAALAVGVDRLRWEIMQSGGDPGVPSSGEIQQDPYSVIEAPLPEPVDSEKLEQAARAAMADVLPGEVSAAVKVYVAQCVASGACRGRAGPPGMNGEPGADGESGEPGADGREPSPVEVATAVFTVCHSELDCEATPEEIAQVVAEYCGQPSMPCGTRWTFEEIFNIAIKAAGSMHAACKLPTPALPGVPFNCTITD